MFSVVYAIPLLCILQINAFDGSLFTERNWSKSNNPNLKRHDNIKVRDGRAMVGRTDQPFLNLNTLEQGVSFKHAIVLDHRNTKKNSDETMKIKINKIQNGAIVSEELNLDDVSFDFEIVSREKLKVTENGHINKLFTQFKKYKGTSKSNNYLKDILDNDHRLQEDGKTAKLLRKIHRRTMRLFRHLKRSVIDGATKKKITYVSRNYDTKFNSKFKSIIRKTKGRNQSNVVQKAMDISDRIINTLVSYVKTDLKQRGILDQYAQFMNTFKEIGPTRRGFIKVECILEDKSCEFDWWSAYVREMFEIILNAPADKFKEVVHALLDSTKKVDFDKVLMDTMKDALDQRLEQLKRKDETELRQGMKDLVVSIAHKDDPVNVRSSEAVWTKKTVAFVDIIELMNRPLHAYSGGDDNYLSNSLKKWFNGESLSSGEPANLTGITDGLLDYVPDAISKMTDAEKNEMTKQMKIILASRRYIPIIN